MLRVKILQMKMSQGNDSELKHKAVNEIVLD